MRGSPPLHLVLFVIGFALLAVPLARLTFARTNAPVNREVSVPDGTRTQIRLRFAHVPIRASVKLEGRELLAANFTRAGNIEFQTELSIPNEGIEFQVSVVWPDGTPDTAFSMELEPDGLDAQSQTRWSGGARMNDVIAFEWKQP